MKFIKKQLSLWRVVLIIGGSAIAIPIAARVSPTAIAVDKEGPAYLDQQTTADNEDADDTHSKDREAAVGEGVALPQDLLYDRRSQYWDKRVLDRLEGNDDYLEEQTKDDKDEDAKDSKADKDDKGGEDDWVAERDEEIDRRREYWSRRLDEDW